MDEYERERMLEDRHPDIDWRVPYRLKSRSGSVFYVCQFCLTLAGGAYELMGPKRPGPTGVIAVPPKVKKYTDPEDVRRHLREEHGGDDFD